MEFFLIILSYHRCDRVTVPAASEESAPKELALCVSREPLLSVSKGPALSVSKGSRHSPQRKSKAIF